MKAIRFHEHGGPEVLRVDEIPDPAPGPGEVVIEIRASALNHVDVDVREGLARVELPLPHVPGVELIGAIASLARTRRRGLAGR